jgi:pyridoxamine 5'-phosphate oxidase
LLTLKNGSLLISNFLDDPIAQFWKWYRDARNISPGDPEAADTMALATSSKNSLIDVRYVLFKGIDTDGFVFFTDYTSKKSSALADNPRAAIAFYWHGLRRQVRIRGIVEKLPSEKSDAYFATRPRRSQAATLLSKQSVPIAFDIDLTSECGKILRSFKGKAIKRPKTWGGFLLVPHEIEFWQAGKNRLNDRYLYVRKGSGKWEVNRLSP